MIVIVCGGRDFEDAGVVWRALDAFHRKHGIDVLIQGGQTGADALAKAWARAQNIPCAQVDAYWERGPKAGPVRNAAMTRLGVDAVIAFPGGRGTASMLRIAKKMQIKVWQP